MRTDHAPLQFRRAIASDVPAIVLEEAERIVCVEWHVAAMRMSVIDVRAELIAFYNRRGLRTGVTKPFPYGNERFGIPRRSDLRFAVLEKALQVEGADRCGSLTM